MAARARRFDHFVFDHFVIDQFGTETAALAAHLVQGVGVQGSRFLRVVHLGRSTSHTISSRGICSPLSCRAEGSGFRVQGWGVRRWGVRLRNFIERGFQFQKDDALKFATQMLYHY